LAAKLILAEDGDDRFLAAFGSDRDLDLALLNVKNRIRDGSLREDFLVLAVLGNRSSFTNIGEESFWVKRLFVAYQVGPLLGIEFKARVFNRLYGSILNPASKASRTSSEIPLACIFAITWER
jgi:hypothetical protein